MPTLYIEKSRLEALIAGRDDRERKWWFARSSSLDDVPRAYLAGHEWAASKATWHELAHSALAVCAAANLKAVLIPPLADALIPFWEAAKGLNLFDARKSFRDFDEKEALALRLFVEGAHAVAVYVVQQSRWSIVETKRA